MTTIPVGFGQAVFRFQRTGAPRISTWTLGIDDQFSASPTPAETAEALYGFFTDTISPFAAASMVGNWAFVGVTVTQMQEVGPLVGEYNFTTTGGAAGAGLTPNVALLIRKQTASGGRRNRGRAYIPPVWPPETKVDYNGVIDSGEVATLQSQYDAAFDAMIAGDIRPVILHSEAPFTPTLITSLNVESLIATQRRRLRK